MFRLNVGFNILINLFCLWCFLILKIFRELILKCLLLVVCGWYECMVIELLFIKLFDLGFKLLLEVVNIN